MNKSAPELLPRTVYNDNELRNELRNLLKMSDHDRLMEAVVDVYRESVEKKEGVERRMHVPLGRRDSDRWKPLIDVLNAAHSLISTLPPLEPRK